MPGNQRFGARLHELRQAQGLSLRGLARQVPCAHVHIRDIELGNKSPSQQLAARLDHILEADGDLVMLAAGADAPQASPWEPMASGFGRRDAEDWPTRSPPGPPRQAIRYGWRTCGSSQ